MGIIRNTTEYLEDFYEENVTQTYRSSLLHVTDTNIQSSKPRHSSVSPHSEDDFQSSSSEPLFNSSFITTTMSSIQEFKSNTSEASRSFGEVKSLPETLIIKAMVHQSRKLLPLLRKPIITNNSVQFSKRASSLVQEIPSISELKPKIPSSFSRDEQELKPPMASRSMIKNHEILKEGNSYPNKGSSTTRSPSIGIVDPKRTLSPNQMANKTKIADQSICASDPCGPDRACYANGVSYDCICSDGTSVDQNEDCPDVKPLDVTPPAIYLPNANATTSSPSHHGLFVGAVTSSLIVVILFALLVWRKKKLKAFLEERKQNQLRKNSSDSSMLSPLNFASNPNYYTSPIDQLPPPLQSVPQMMKSHINFVGDLGEGCFGKVYKGEYEVQTALENDPDRSFGSEEDRKNLSDSYEESSDGNGSEKVLNNKKIVAVKVLKEFVGGEAEIDFLREVEIMSTFNHPNILSLIGIVVAEVGKIPWMVFEFMSYGDLAEVLRSCNKLNSKNYMPMQPIKKLQLLDIGIQIAAGMDYLSAQHFVHRDLACRNCLVGDNLTVKISDFGMSRDVYTCDYYKVCGSRMLPVRWMPPESIMYGKFTLESDVWAFGVVLWEIFSYGKQPYYGNSNEQVVQLILQGILLQPMDFCPYQVREIMRLCWRSDPSNRLSFQQIYQQLRSAEEVLSSLEGIQDSTNQNIINYSQLCLHETPTFETDQDQYLLPKNYPQDQYLTVLND